MLILLIEKWRVNVMVSLAVFVGRLYLQLMRMSTELSRGG